MNKLAIALFIASIITLLITLVVCHIHNSRMIQALREITTAAQQAQTSAEKVIAMLESESRTVIKITSVVTFPTMLTTAFAAVSKLAASVLIALNLQQAHIPSSQLNAAHRMESATEDARGTPPYMCSGSRPQYLD